MSPRYIPRIFTDDALRIDRTGKISSLIHITDKRDDKLFFINRSDLTPEGVIKAAQHHRQNWIDHYASQQDTITDPALYYYDVSFTAERGAEFTRSDRAIDPKDVDPNWGYGPRQWVNPDYRPSVHKVASDFAESFLQEIEAAPQAFIKSVREMTPNDPIIPDAPHLISTLEHTIARDLPERLRRFGAAEAPMIIVTDHFEKYDRSLVNEQNTLGMHIPRGDHGALSTSYGGLILIKPKAVDLGNIITEEMEHALNAKVGFDREAWLYSAESDFMLPSAQEFMKNYSSKDTAYPEHNSWVKRYHPDQWGVETLAELNYAYENFVHRDHMTPEKAMQKIMQAMPECGQLFEAYKEAEQQYFASLLMPKPEAPAEFAVISRGQEVPVAERIRSNHFNLSRKLPPGALSSGIDAHLEAEIARRKAQQAARRALQ